MFIKCYQVDSCGQRAVGYNLTEMSEKCNTDCWINPETGIMIRVDYKGPDKKEIRERTIFNISNSQGDSGYCRAVLINPLKIVEKLVDLFFPVVEEIKEEVKKDEPKKRDRKIYK